MTATATTTNTLSLLHVAIIMDGNGRWATRQGLPRIAGHRAGVETLRRIVESAAQMDVGTLTVYAFSSDNWGRPRAEVQGLMLLLRNYLRREVERCVRDGVRVSVIGRRDRLPDSLPTLIEEMEAATAGCEGIHLRLAIDYSSRDELLNTVLRLAQQQGCVTRAALSRETGPDVDLLIRTSGEQRLSDFLLWESAYAEIIFSPRLWPEFGREDLAEAIEWFQRRDRRYGRLGAA